VKKGDWLIDGGLPVTDLPADADLRRLVGEVNTLGQLAVLESAVEEHLQSEQLALERLRNRAGQYSAGFGIALALFGGSYVLRGDESGYSNWAFAAILAVVACGVAAFFQSARALAVKGEAQPDSLRYVDDAGIGLQKDDELKFRSRILKSRWKLILALRASRWRVATHLAAADKWLLVGGGILFLLVTGALLLEVARGTGYPG